MAGSYNLLLSLGERERCAREVAVPGTTTNETYSVTGQNDLCFTLAADHPPTRIATAASLSNPQIRINGVQSPLGEGEALGLLGGIPIEAPATLLNLVNRYAPSGTEVGVWWAPGEAKVAGTAVVAPVYADILPNPDSSQTSGTPDVLITLECPLPPPSGAACQYHMGCGYAERCSAVGPSPGTCVRDDELGEICDEALSTATSAFRDVIYDAVAVNGGYTDGLAAAVAALGGATQVALLGRCSSVSARGTLERQLHFDLELRPVFRPSAAWEDDWMAHAAGGLLLAQPAHVGATVVFGPYFRHSSIFSEFEAHADCRLDDSYWGQLLTPLLGTLLAGVDIGEQVRPPAERERSASSSSPR